MTFEKHLSSVSSAAAQRLGIMRKSWQVFHDRSFVLRSFWSFVLPVLEYCSAVWCSAADSHLKLLDRVMVVDFTIFDLAGLVLYLTKIILYVNYDGSRCNTSIVAQA